MTTNFDKIDEQESWDIFDSAAQRLLELDGQTFAKRWDHGDYTSDADPKVMRVAMLRPSGR